MKKSPRAATSVIFSATVYLTRRLLIPVFTNLHTAKPIRPDAGALHSEKAKVIAAIPVEGGGRRGDPAGRDRPSGADTLIARDMRAWHAIG